MRYFVVAAFVLSCSVAMADDSPSGMCPTPKRDPIHYSLDNLAKGWFEPAIEVHEHSHPLVHGFLVETAFTHRSMLTEASFSDGNEIMNLEFDLPASRRLSVLINLPWVLDYYDASGIGDLSLGVRGIWSESDDYVLSSIVEVGIPTGDYDVSLNEVSVGFTVANWWYLGGGYCVQSNIGMEWVPELIDSEALSVKAMVSKTFEKVSVGGLSSDISISLEGGLDAPLSEGEVTGELGFGTMFSATKALEVRLGYYWSLDGGDNTFRLGTIWEF